MARKAKTAYPPLLRARKTQVDGDRRDDRAEALTVVPRAAPGLVAVRVGFPPGFRLSGASEQLFDTSLAVAVRGIGRVIGKHGTPATRSGELVSLNDRPVLVVDFVVTDLDVFRRRVSDLAFVLACDALILEAPTRFLAESIRPTDYGPVSRDTTEAYEWVDDCLPEEQ